MSILDRQPPTNFDAERCVLGSILLDPRTLDSAITRISADDFYDDANREIFLVMLALESNSIDIDVETLSHALMSQNLWQAIGGAPYIAKVARSVPHASHIESYVQIVSDQAERRRYIEMAARIAEASYDTTRSVEQIRELINSQAMETLDKGQRARISPIGDGIDEITGQIIEGTYGRDQGASTPFDCINRFMGGLKPVLIILGARPSTGKSALALQLALHAGRQNTGQTVGFFSLESLKDEIQKRALISQSRVTQDRFNEAQRTPNDRNALRDASYWLRQSNVLISDNPDMTVAEIAAQTRIWARQHNLAFIVVDYLQLINIPERDEKKSRQQQVGQISRALKKLSMNLRIPVLALAQLNREGGEFEKPKLSNLREAGDIEQDADDVIFLWRKPEAQESNSAGEGLEARLQRRNEQQAKSAPESRREIILTIGKNRNGPRDMDFDLTFHADQFRFTEPGFQWQEQAAEREF